MLPILIATMLAAAPKPHAKAAAEPAVKAFPFPIELHTLDNGLRVALIPYDSPGLAAYFTLMRVGSRNEVEKGRSGYAHFFEHMMFRGTKTHSSKDYNDTVTRLGLDSNASTDNDLTLYHLYGPAKALPTIIEYEADRFQHLEYDEAAFRTEAGAILGEYTKSASNPDQKLYEVMSETAYKVHSYAHTVIGYLTDVKNMPAGFDYSREFFRRYYTPDNATVIVIGDFDKADTLARITKAYAGWNTKLDEAKIPAEPKQTVSRHAQVTWDKPTLPRIWMAWHSPAASDLKSAAVQNLLNAYLFGPTSPLYQDLVLSKQIVEGMDATYGDHRDPGLFGVVVRVKDKKDLAAVEHAVLKDVSALAAGKVDAARMTAVRSNLVYSNIMGLEKADALALVLAYNTELTGDFQFLNKEFDAIAKIVPGDLQEFAKKYLQDNNRTTVTLVSGGAQ
jgi:zinc protease